MIILKTNSSVTSSKISKGFPQRSVFVSLTSVPATPKGSFGTHFGENIKARLSDLQTGSFVE